MNDGYISEVKRLSRDTFSAYEGNACIKITEVKDKTTKCPSCNKPWNGSKRVDVWVGEDLLKFIVVCKNCNCREVFG